MYVTMSVYSLTKIMHLCRFYRFVQYLFFETNYCSYFIRLNESLKIKQGKSKLVVTSTYSHLNWQIFPVFNVRGFSLWGIHSWVSYNFLCSYCSDIRKGFFENKGKIRLILQLLYVKLMKYISCDITLNGWKISNHYVLPYRITKDYSMYLKMINIGQKFVTLRLNHLLLSVVTTEED